jgi:hypothetical protein
MIIANCSLRFSDNYFSSGRVVGHPEVIVATVLQAIIGDFHGAAVTLFEPR